MTSKTIVFKSDPPQTPYAPEYYYVITETYYDNVIDTNKIAEFFLGKEEQILSLPESDAGETGLPTRSTTNRHRNYNVFQWEDELDDLKKLRKAIKRCHKEYGKICFGPFYSYDKRLYIRCWVNIMRKGHKIQPHIHSTHPHTYLGGHFTVSCRESHTIYSNPINQLLNGEKYYSANHPGKLTLFPNNVPHETTKHKFDEPRITIAFDLTPIPDPGSCLLPL
jgi:hypothetical protein